MINRILGSQLPKLAKQYPVISVTGPRQSGKTTLIQQVFSDYEYFNLEDPNTRMMIMDDPKQFVNPQRTRVIFDEIQKYPELLSFIQVTVDEVGHSGCYIISGSQNLLLLEKVSQSLAGRVAITKLLPLSLTELKSADRLKTNPFEQILFGFYPRLYQVNPSQANLNQAKHAVSKQTTQEVANSTTGLTTAPLKPTQFYGNYLASYVERDVRQIKNISSLSTFQRFMALLAGRVGQLFNAASIANDLGITSKTARAWLNILEASYITFRLQPYYKNFGKRVVKSSKLYFYDVGLLAYLLKIDNQAEIETHFARGHLFENLIIAEIMKMNLNRRLRPKLYYWRDRTGHEVDLLIDQGTQINVVEIKSSATYKSRFLQGLNYWNQLDKTPPGKKMLVYSGELENKVKNCQIVNWQNLTQWEAEVTS
jgi:hypothetical protein